MIRYRMRDSTSDTRITAIIAEKSGSNNHKLLKRVMMAKQTTNNIM
jgi:hypothetical protein